MTDRGCKGETIGGNLKGMELAGKLETKAVETFPDFDSFFTGTCSNVFSSAGSSIGGIHTALDIHFFPALAVLG